VITRDEISKLTNLRILNAEFAKLSMINDVNLGMTFCDMATTNHLQEIYLMNNLQPPMQRIPAQLKIFLRGRMLESPKAGY